MSLIDKKEGLKSQEDYVQHVRSMMVHGTAGPDQLVMKRHWGGGGGSWITVGKSERRRDTRRVD